MPIAGGTWLDDREAIDDETILFALMKRKKRKPEYQRKKLGKRLKRFPNE